MDNGRNQKSVGLEQLEYLTDKAKRLIFQLEADEQGLQNLRDEIRQISHKKKELEEINHDLQSKLSSLQADREEVDEKIGKLLQAISDLPLE